MWKAWQAASAELVEALEKAQETIAFQQGEIKALLSSLESRTVKLPDLRQIVSGTDMSGLMVFITTAGRKGSAGRRWHQGGG